MVEKRTYVDHAATTAIRPSVVEAYTQALRYIGNPSSQHTSGRRVRGVFDDAIAQIAEFFGVPRSWIIMTSGGTEADNIALRGVQGRVVAAVTDHPAVIDTAKALGGDLAPVDSNGLVDLGALEELVGSREGSESASLISAALVNNETGVIQDLEAIARVARRVGAHVHTDAVQATGYVSLPNFDQVQLASITGHKIGAPVGVGALIANPAVKLAASGTGGGQQRGIRSGTLDAAHAVAFATALQEVCNSREAETARLTALAGRLRDGITALEPRAVMTAKDAPRSAHVVHVCFDGADQDAMLFVLDQVGIDCSAGSACHSGVTQASHVLSAMGYSNSLMRGAIRFSLGWTSTEADVDHVLRELPRALETARSVGSSIRPS